MRRLVARLSLVGAVTAPLVGFFFVGCVQPSTLGNPSAAGGGTSGGRGGSGGGGGTSAASTAPPPVIYLDASMNGPDLKEPEDLTPPLPTGDANCGSATSTATRQPADVLLVLDRSGSMDYSIAEDCYCTQQSGGGGTVCSNTSNCTTRWPSLTSAVDATLTATTGSINWGLKLYSSTGNGCTVSNGVEVAVSGTSVSTVQTQIGSTKPGGNTPTAQAITAATAYLKTVNDNNNHVILLSTDGEPNCASGGSSTPNVQATVDAITAAKSAGFLVYVIGIGPQAALTNLQSFAVAGGTGSYYPATSPQALTDAFASISKLVATCVFTSTQPPPAPDNVAVYLNKNLVTKDDLNGWTFGSDTQTIILNGTACDEAMTANSAVQILFGCPGGPPPPSVIP